MREITEIIIHCSATPEGQPICIGDIDYWHRQRGFDKVGYHYVIKLNGEVQKGRQPAEVGAHCYGHNMHSIGICYVGGLRRLPHRTGIPWHEYEPADTRTPEQKKALRELVLRLKRRFPAATVHGHNEFANKACPCFDVQKEFGE